MKGPKRGNHYIRPHVIKNFEVAYYEPFKPGNRLSAKENLSESANNKRLQALFRGWATRQRKTRGEKVMTAKTKAKIKKRARHRLIETVAREHREIQDIARRNSEGAMRRAIEIYKDTSAPYSVQLAAIEMVIDRAYGKATQTNVNASVEANGKPSEISAKELEARIAQALRAIEDATGGAPKPAKSKKQPAGVREHDRDPNGSTVH